LRKFLSITATELLQTFSFRKYGIAVTIILVTCFVNYYSGFQFWKRGEQFLFSFAWYFTLFFVFFVAGILVEMNPASIKSKTLPALLVIAPFLFALKVSIPFAGFIPQEVPGSYRQAFQQPASWLGGLLLISLLLLCIHRFAEGKWNLYGSKKTGSLSPYLFLVVLMVPLLVWASLQSDFSLVYPKAKIISASLGNEAKPWHYLLFEAAYASDFITIELFFRGFLVLSLSKVLGRKCILPVALFYFSIHLGKPMFEAISSFFGGMILGTIAYHSKSIRGGWVIHVSIALLMELFGYLF
jgi:hypothetical protein